LGLDGGGEALRGFGVRLQSLGGGGECAKCTDIARRDPVLYLFEQGDHLLVMGPTVRASGRRVHGAKLSHHRPLRIGERVELGPISTRGLAQHGHRHRFRVAHAGAVARDGVDLCEVAIDRGLLYSIDRRGPRRCVGCRRRRGVPWRGSAYGRLNGRCTTLVFPA
jgi:hypothetical protein